MRWAQEDLADLAEEAGEHLADAPGNERAAWAEDTFGDDLGGGEQVARLVDDDGPAVRYDPQRGVLEVNVRERGSHPDE